MHNAITNRTRRYRQPSTSTYSNGKGRRHKRATGHPKDAGMGAAYARSSGAGEARGRGDNREQASRGADQSAGKLIHWMPKRGSRVAFLPNLLAMLDLQMKVNAKQKPLKNGGWGAAP